MPAIPAFMLKKLYVKGSLANTATGFRLSLKNTLAPGTIIGFSPLIVDGKAYPPEQITVTTGSKSTPASQIGSNRPYPFPVGSAATLEVSGEPLAPGEHTLAISVETREVGELRIEVSDAI
ncbi:MAG: hydroxymethylglutaryl-CoA reductase [Anaerolineae bacterium]